MTAYRMYLIDGGGHFSPAEWIEADSDEAAIVVARAKNTSTACELWQGQRFVGRVDTIAFGGEES